MAQPGSGMAQPGSSMAQPGSSMAQPGSGMAQPPTWEQLKSEILDAIKKDAKPEEFKNLHNDVLNCIDELERTQ